jgi:mannose-1-phosphate guanylyltransferase
LNAFLLAAGLGTRLKPLTLEIPKCLVDVCGKPLLGWWLEKLDNFGIQKVLINTHHLAHEIKDFIEKYESKMEITSFHEETLLGSAGTVRENLDFADKDDFLIIYADNLTDVSLEGITDFHRRNSALLTVGVMEMPRPKTRGIIVMDDKGIVVRFKEKPANPPGNLAFAGILVASPKISAYLEDDKLPLDFGYDVLPKMVGKMHGYELKGYLQDIGNPEDLESARNKWADIITRKS